MVPLLEEAGLILAPRGRHVGQGDRQIFPKRHLQGARSIFLIFLFPVPLGHSEQPKETFGFSDLEFYEILRYLGHQKARS